MALLQRRARAVAERAFWDSIEWRLRAGLQVRPRLLLGRAGLLFSPAGQGAGGRLQLRARPRAERPPGRPRRPRRRALPAWRRSWRRWFRSWAPTWRRRWPRRAPRRSCAPSGPRRAWPRSCRWAGARCGGLPLKARSPAYVRATQAPLAGGPAAAESAPPARTPPAPPQVRGVSGAALGGLLERLGQLLLRYCAPARAEEARAAFAAVRGELGAAMGAAASGETPAAEVPAGGRALRPPCMRCCPASLPAPPAPPCSRALTCSGPTLLRRSAGAAAGARRQAAAPAAAPAQAGQRQQPAGHAGAGAAGGGRRGVRRTYQPMPSSLHHCTAACSLDLALAAMVGPESRAKLGPEPCSTPNPSPPTQVPAHEVCLHLQAARARGEHGRAGVCGAGTMVHWGRC